MQLDDARDEGDVDYARIIHSAPFRRLQGKTQILNLGDSDFYRTRLTHSLEVAQISGSVTRQLERRFSNHPATGMLPARSMIHAMGCAHDLGHPPFGHGGEVALNYCMYDPGNVVKSGFEGNGQTLRILGKLESYSDNKAANLTRRTLLGILKYPVSYSQAYNPELVPGIVKNTEAIKVIDPASSKPPKCYLDEESELVEWILAPLAEADRHAFLALSHSAHKHAKAKHKSLDCSIMDVSDDIAYGIHDLEDAIALDLISERRFREVVTEEECSSFLEKLKEKYPGESQNDVYGVMVENLFGTSEQRKHYINRMVHHLVTAVNYREYEQFDEPLLRFRAEMAEPQRIFLDALQRLIVEDVITNPNVQHLEFKGQNMVVAVFEALQSEPARLLPRAALSRYERSGGSKRVICDHVASMTDTGLLKTYERLFAPRMGSVFDKL